jgi:tRNA dimethylallyltransferase
MEYPDTPPDWEYRNELENIRLTEGNEVLWNMLHAVDPEYAEELSVENYRYVMRGLEVLRATGRSKRESHGKKKLRFSPLFITPYTDSERGELYAHIDKRVA